MSIPPRRKQYAIHRVRLINFHNIQNETINIHQGGHLFLLGDNGSGKTTVLDAIHYVLTAGELVEFNSAARVVGQRSEGRRLQGIIMRFNTETGPLNQNGGVTYAVIELRDEKGACLCLGLGMSCRSMEEQLQRWGFIDTRPLEELPLLMEDENGLRPRDRTEMKEALEPYGSFYNIGPFRREITSRLFNNPDVFNDICRLLRLGKAYREIVAQSNDYHELFMRLMPEPKTEIFERVVDSLQSLEESKSVLEDFERKQRYVKDMDNLRNRIAAAREEMVRHDWLEQNLASEERSQLILSEEKNMLALKAKLNQAMEERKALIEERERAYKILDDLKTKDREGLVRQEKEAGVEFSRKKEQKLELLERIKHQQKDYDFRLREVERERANLRKLLTDTNQHLVRFAPELPFPTTELIADLDRRFRSEFPETESSPLAIADPAEHARTEIIRQERESSILEKEARELAADIEKMNKAIHKFEAEQTVTPSIRHYGEALELLRQNMIHPHSLYEGLEWKPGVTQATKALVEELIGPQVLATFMVDEQHYTQTRDLVVSHFPHLRVTHAGLGIQECPAWFRQTFDMATSHPHAISCLSAEMVAPKDPLFQEIQGFMVVKYRGHERRLAVPSARLIGTESRNKALAREVKEQQQSLKEVSQRQKEVLREAGQIRERLEVLTKFSKFLETTQSQYMTQVPGLVQQNLSLDHLSHTLEESQSRLRRLEADLAHLQERRDLTRQLISKEGLANLEEKVASAQVQLAKLEDQLANLDNRRGRLTSEADSNKARLQELERAQTEVVAKLEEISARLRQIQPTITDLESYILVEHQGGRFKTVAEITQARKRANDLEVETKTLLGAKMNDPSLGATFAFTYDETHNHLSDRRGRSIAELLDLQRKTIDDQRQVVNEETFMLFKEIIMKELIGELRKMVFDLEEMSRNINELLKKRAFGNHRYRFSLRPRTQYKHLVNIIHSIDRFDSEPEKELREFFEDHKDEIINTEAGEIPDLLDYRNWYLFEMQVMRVREDGELSDKVVMTRRIKGLGSGGEQAVPNYLLVLTIAHFLFKAGKARIFPLLFDEAFYGIDANRRDQLLGFASDLGLQLFVASPDQDGVKREIDYSTTLLIVKDIHYNVHTYKFDWRNPDLPEQTHLFESNAKKPIAFEEEQVP